MSVHGPFGLVVLRVRTTSHATSSRSAVLRHAEFRAPADQTNTRILTFVPRVQVPNHKVTTQNLKYDSIYIYMYIEPKGSRHLIMKELGLTDHDYSGFWGLSPSQLCAWNLWEYPNPRLPNVPLLRALWYLLDGIWGSLKGSWGVLE